MKRIAIVGGGIVGMTAAYYLSKEKNVTISLYDDEKQASKAAVGIICPWLNQRRNKEWYNLVRDGAEFYDDLIKELSSHSFYQKVGALYINPRMEEKIYEIALKRSLESYKVGKVAKVSKLENPELTPPTFKWDTGIYVSGAARVDGGELLEVLLKKSLKQGLEYFKDHVSVEDKNGVYEIDGKLYDQVLLSPGPHLKGLMIFKPEYSLDLWAQKGQLISFNLKNSKSYPVIMPKGEIDFLFGDHGNLVVGASHENDFADGNVDWEVLNRLKDKAVKHYPALKNQEISSYRLGFRAHNSSYTPFYGNLKKDPNIFVASALGSSGLTSGPIIGYRLARGIIEMTKELEDYYNANDYVLANKKEKPE